MKREAEEQLEHLKETFDKEFDAKYRTGNREHGGDILEMTPLESLNNAKDEIFDLFSYVQSGIDALHEKDKQWKIPKNKINGERFGQMLWNVLAKEYCENDSHSTANKHIVCDVLFNIENETFNKLLKKYINEHKIHA